MRFSVSSNLIAVATMWLLHMFLGTFALIHYYHPWATPALPNYPPYLFWPEPDHMFRAERSPWVWPQSPQRWPNHYQPLWPVAAGPSDYEPESPSEAPFRPNKAPPNRFDQTTFEPTPVDEVTPERFGFEVQTTKARPTSKSSSTPTEGSFTNSDSGSSLRPTRIRPFQTANSVPVSESSSATTTEAWTFPPTTQDPIQAKIQLSMCINNCVTDKSIKSVCGSDNKTYQNRQFLDCAQQCGQNIRLDYTGRCVPNPPSG